jgi:hypothetical protein
MKTVFLILVFAVLLPATALCQKTQPGGLTLNDLISLYNSDYDEVNDFLSPRGWIYKSHTEEEINPQGYVEKHETMTWVYGYVGYSNQALGWFGANIYYGSIVSVWYQCEKPFFDAIKQKAISIGMKKIESTVSEYGHLISVYQGANYKIKFAISTDGGYIIQLLAAN